VDMLRHRNIQSLERLKLVQRKSENALLRRKLEAVETELTAQVKQGALAGQLRQAEAERAALARQLPQSQARLHAAQAQAEHFRLRLEQIEHSTSWRTLRRVQPLLAGLRPALRPPLRLAYRAYRRLKNRPLSPTPHAGPLDPVWQPRNLQLELRLEPVWNEAAGHCELEYDKCAPAHEPGGWVKPYHVVPFHPDGPPEKRILHIIANVFVGGSTQLVIDLVQKLPRPYEHVILTAALWPGGTHTGIEVHHVQAPDPLAMAQVLDRVRPDIVHMHYWGLNDDVWYHAALEALRGRGVPAVENVNTPIAPLVDPVFSTYVFVSQYVLERFGEEVTANGAAVDVIHPGIDLHRFEGQESAPDAQNAIGMVYRLEHDKLNEDSIELLIEVVRRRPRTRAYVVGGGSLLQPYLERTEQAGVRENFRFSGYVPYESLPGWYEKFRIFVAPVWKESFGQVAPFAMSKGCTVAGYDIGALAEIVGGHETLGHDVGEAAGIIVALLNDPEKLERMGQANRLRARELFGLTKMIERYTAIYDRMLPR
jgi:glycosyltransferase involved in cell wall biosynthesis